MLSITKECRDIYSGAAVGILTMMDVANPSFIDEVDELKIQLIDSLRETYGSYDRAELKNIEPIKSYNNYYKKFKKTYHVQHQLESVVFKGKSIPGVAALVEAMFIAELKNLLLTAGHDLDKIELPLKLEIASGMEKYIGISNMEQHLLQGDMMITDGKGIISSIIYGPDYRTRITPETKNVVFCIYGPLGIGEQRIYEHLKDIESNVSIVSPNAKTDRLEVLKV